MKVLYLNIENRSYPRNHRIREYLVTHGHQVEAIDRPRNCGYLQRCIRLLRTAMATKQKPNVIFMAEFGNSYAWVAWIVAKKFGVPLIVDGFIGMYETHVIDRQLHRSGSVRARAYQSVDWIALHAADLYLVDTDARAKLFGTGADTRVLSLPVGAPSWCKTNEHRGTVPNQKIRVLYYGNYIPLHGLDVAIRGVSLADKTVDIDLKLIGPLDQSEKYYLLAHELGLKCVTFLDSVPGEELPEHLDHSDVVLGVFGGSLKAKTVIANKVWQGLAAGRMVLTQESVALSELRPIVGEQLIEVAPTPEAISSALLDLAQNGVPAIRSLSVGEALEAYVDSKYADLGRHLEMLTVRA